MGRICLIAASCVALLACTVGVASEVVETAPTQDGGPATVADGARPSVTDDASPPTADGASPASPDGATGIDPTVPVLGRPVPVEADLVRTDGPSAAPGTFFHLVDFEDGETGGMRGSIVSSHSYSGTHSIDTPSVLGAAYGQGGNVRFPEPIGMEGELWIRFRIFFPDGYVFNSCTRLGLGGCRQSETNDSIKFIGIEMRHEEPLSTGRHWMNLKHDADDPGNDTPYLWVYEGFNAGFLRIGSDGLPPGFPLHIQTGQWETFEYYTRFSDTPIDDKINGSGELVLAGGGTAEVRIYKNGQLIRRVTDSSTMRYTDQLARSLMLLEYWNGGAPADQSVYFDEIILTNRVPRRLDSLGLPYLGVD